MSRGFPLRGMMLDIADTPEPPYYAVVFTSLHSDDLRGYDEMASKMLELAQQQPGYLGVESAREGLGITVSYWSSLEAITAWKRQAQHAEAQRQGKARWYQRYKTRICLVERDYGSESE